MTILLLEDDPAVVRTVEVYAMRQGYRLTATTDGDEALEAVAQGAVDVALVDLMLPGWSGWDVVEEMRRLSALPIIVISALTSLDRRLQLLGLGADDYLVKPFEPAELMARLATILRRTRALTAAGPIHFGPFALDREGRALRREGVAVELTASEFSVLEALVENAGRTLSRAQLLARLHSLGRFAGRDPLDASTRMVDVHIAALRAKLGDDAHHPRWIATVWGTGYRFERHDSGDGAP